MKQSLGLLLSSMVAVAVGHLPLVWFLSPVLQLFVTIVWFITVYFALTGREEPAPIIGKYFLKINI